MHSRIGVITCKKILSLKLSALRGITFWQPSDAWRRTLNEPAFCR